MKTRIKDWANYYKVSPGRYEMRALVACYDNDGEAVLREVLKELGLTQSIDLIRDAAKRQ